MTGGDSCYQAYGSKNKTGRGKPRPVVLLPEEPNEKSKFFGVV